MQDNKAKRLKDLKTENVALKKMLAKAELSQVMLKHLAEKNGYPRTVTPGPPPTHLCSAPTAQAQQANEITPDILDCWKRSCRLVPL